MGSTRNILFSFVFAISALGLVGCGGGNNNPVPAAAPGACAAGSVYSSQYGCLVQGNCLSGSATYQGSCIPVQNTVMSNCQQQPGQPPLIFTAQYGCLPQGSCPYGQGSYVVNNTVQCVAGQMGGVMPGYSSCFAGQIMTARGCLPQGYCAPGFGYIDGRCISGRNVRLSNGSDEDGDDDQDSAEETVRYRRRYTTRASVRIRY